LYETLEQALMRARQFREGFLRKASTRERQEWMNDAAELLQALAQELRGRIPPESYSAFIARHPELGSPFPAKSSGDKSNRSAGSDLCNSTQCVPRSASSHGRQRGIAQTRNETIPEFRRRSP
jgi:hypothetical protein